MPSILKLTLLATAAVGAISLSTAAQAAVTTYSSLSSWEAAVGTWSETTSLGASEHSIITSFATTDGVVVSSTGTVDNIGSGWSTWSGGYTGQVLNNGDASVSFSLGSPVTAFGFFAEPDSFSAFDITLNTSDGATLTQVVAGDGGAAFFGWVGSGVGSFSVSTTDNDFAAGDFFSRRGGVPEPATWAMMLVGFGGLGAALRGSRRHQAVVRA